MDLLHEALQRLGAERIVRTSEGYEALCPFCHATGKRTFRIAFKSTKRGKNRGRPGAWKCHKPSCQAAEGGYIHDLVMKAFRLDWHGACALVERRGMAHHLSEGVGEEYEEEEIDESRVYPYIGKPCPYLTETRGLEQQDLDYFRIGYNERQDLVVIPNYSVENELVGLTTRHARPKGMYIHSEFKKSHHLYGLCEAVRDGLTQAALTEGHLDAPGLRPHVEEDIACVSQLGSSLSAEQAALLVKHGFEEVILVYDNDAAGFMATLAGIDQLRNAGLVDIHVALYNAADPGSLSVSHGEITDIITSSRWLSSV